MDLMNPLLRSSPTGHRTPPGGGGTWTKAPAGTHLHFLHHLLAEGADLGGAGDGHVLRALVLAAHAVEARRLLRRVVVQIRLTGKQEKKNHMIQSGR